MTELAVRQNTGIAPLPSEVEWRTITGIAGAIANSAIVPDAYRGKEANVIVAALTGRPFGWDPLTSMRNITVIQGTATIKPEAMLGLIRAAGHHVSGEATNSGATVKGKRRDTGDEMTFSFTLEDAQRAGLASKQNWKNYPASMCWARAVAQLGRMLFPDVLLGLSYTADEIGANTDEEGNVVVVTSTRQDAPAPAPAPIVIDQEPTLNAEVGSITRNQQAELHILKDRIGLTEEKYREGLKKMAGVESSKDLSEESAAKVVTTLRGMLDKLPQRISKEDADDLVEIKKQMKIDTNRWLGLLGDRYQAVSTASLTVEQGEDLVAYLAKILAAGGELPESTPADESAPESADNSDLAGNPYATGPDGSPF